MSSALVYWSTLSGVEFDRAAAPSRRRTPGGEVLLDLVETLLHAALLVSLALALGGVAWGLVVLRDDPPRPAVRRCLLLTGVGGALLVAGQTALLVWKTVLLSHLLGHDAFGGFATTSYFGAGSLRLLLAVGLVGAVARLARASAAPGRWIATAALALGIAVSGAWLSHAASRLQERPTLMALTALHQAAMAVWLGGIVQVIALSPLARRHPDVGARWPALLRRFSRLAATSVGVLAFSGAVLVWMYVGTVEGLVGSGYGSLILAKAVLLGVALGLAAPTAWAIWRRSHDAPVLAPGSYRATLVEAEAIVLVMALVTASGLSAQPPAIDLPATNHATVAELVETFRPKMPSLRTPSPELLRASRVPGQRSPDAYRWSNFSHNVAGLILLATSLLALAGVAARRRWAWPQPLGFAALAAFIYLRAAANEGTWPFGAVGLAQLDTEGLQHRVAAVLVLALGMVEWRARGARPARTWLSYVVPALAAGGAILLLAHSHTAFEAKASFLVQVTHTAMGVLGALMVTAQWLEARLAPPGARLASGAAALAMLLVAFVLLFYREANILLPPK